jgi:shikimate dehydrogenase
VHLIGGGGVARAIGCALMDKGVSQFTVTDLDRGRAEALAALLKGKVQSQPGDADIVINCTPLGMKVGDALPCEVSSLGKAIVVSDVTTKPEITPFLAAARARGLAVTTGRDMFEAQVDAVARFFGWL